MISLTKDLSPINLPLAEAVKINCLYKSYSDIALFWKQNDGDAIISMLDGNMTIYNKSANIDELLEFVRVISPSSIFSDANTLTLLFGEKFHRVCVMKSHARYECLISSDTLSSRQAYDLLNIEGLSLPDYEHFAVDFCHRLNHGHLKYFAIEDKCIAVAIFDESTALINGIASHEKGFGRVALGGLLASLSHTPIAVCEDKLKPFYIKNHFFHSYDAGYWRKSS